MFIDSSIIIEVFKGNQKAIDIAEALLFRNFICINEVVYSEVMYQLCFRKDFSKEKIGKLLLESFNFLNINKNILALSLNYMNSYKIKPNDSLIVATCKFYKIDKLISLDSDFEKICKNEKIQLINSKEQI